MDRDPLVSLADCHFNAYSFATSPDRIHDLDLVSKPAFTEASFVRRASDAFEITVRRLYEGEMEVDTTGRLHRSSSHRSNASVRSQRSQRSLTVRTKPRKFSSYTSSSASSLAPSDKSLTSFPSFPQSPQDQRLTVPPPINGNALSPRKSSDPAPSIVDSLTTSSPSERPRTALFDDAPVSTLSVPGALHHANDEHIERIIARNGAVALVRQIAEDLAQRDAQIAALRRKAEERERALRKIILECGISNLDLETRLRAIENEAKGVNADRRHNDRAPLEDMMSDAMSDIVSTGDMSNGDNDATIRANDALRALVDGDKAAKGTGRGWKDYIWGTTKKTTRASSASSGAITNLQNAGRVRPNGSSHGRQTVLQNDVFHPPSAASTRSPSQSPSVQSQAAPERKASNSLATLALKLVAGNNNVSRDTEGSRGRTNGTGGSDDGRAPSATSTRTIASTKSALARPNAKGIPGSRRITISTGNGNGSTRGLVQDRWDTMGASPQSTTSSAADNYGPVEMDTIIDPDDQPPTLTYSYNHYYPSEFLTDRFGFIYDQRRKRRQKEAADAVKKSKRGSRVEMLSGAREGLSSAVDEEDSGSITTSSVKSMDFRPDTPTFGDERTEDSKPTKRWQDYLKIATFPTELLSHTPSAGLPGFEVMEGGEVPRSPGIMTEERGFAPASTSAAVPPTVSGVTDNATISKPVTNQPTTALEKEEVEPVKLLLQQLSEVHDSLQREKTVKWNEFLRKVRAERKREGEAAAAAASSGAEGRSQRAMTIMPEATLTDGELIGISGLGIKGRVGRAKWSEFKTLLLGGIPVTLRAKIWAECSGATTLRVPGYYEDLVAHREGEDDPAIVAQIRMDINRTLTDNIFFRKGPGVAKLNEVLLAYSRRNAEVGYCQGMNLITACLLLIMPTAEDAFWILTSIIENILPRGYYDHSLLASRADQQVLRQYVAAILPKLSAHLDDLSIELEALTFQWFLSVFTDCLSAEALFRVWDVVLCTNDGSTFLFQVALALLKLNEQQLLNCSTPASVYTYINHQMTNHAISIDGLIHASEGLKRVVRREDVEIRRAKAIEAEKDLMREREERNRIRQAERAAKANEVTQEVILEAEVEADHAPTEEEATPRTPTTPMTDTDEPEELAVRTPIPVEEEMDLSLG
jgi:hypothetical protein